MNFILGMGPILQLSHGVHENISKYKKLQSKTFLTSRILDKGYLICTFNVSCVFCSCSILLISYLFFLHICDFHLYLIQEPRLQISHVISIMKVGLSMDTVTQRMAHTCPAMRSKWPDCLNFLPQPPQGQWHVSSHICWPIVIQQKMAFVLAQK